MITITLIIEESKAGYCQPRVVHTKKEEATVMEIAALKMQALDKPRNMVDMAAKVILGEIP